MKLLAVGDVHATPDELEDCKDLFRLVEEVAVAEKVDYVLLLGDSYHTMNVMRVEVMAFWRGVFTRFNNLGIKVLALVGNHDYAGEGLLIHSMMAHMDQIRVIETPTKIEGVAFMPYYSDREMFVRDAVEVGCDTLFCHQTFAGSVYENGFYAEDGIDPTPLPQLHIVSGHIHSPQSFGRVWYVGAPRWRTLSDANVARHIYTMDFKADGTYNGAKHFETGNHCRQIRYEVDSPDKPFDGVLTDNCDWRIDIRGPEAYIEKRKPLFVRPGVRVRTFPDTKRRISVKESEGVEKAFDKYINGYLPKHGTPIEVLTKMARERLGI